VAPIVAPVHSEAEIETVITSLGSEPGGGLIVMPDTFVESRRAHTILLAARNNVPAVYPDSVWPRDGLARCSLLTMAALLAALGILILFEVIYPFQYAQLIPSPDLHGTDLWPGNH
jgi:hypothetical protein